MENEKTFFGNEKLEFRQIVLSHIRNILNLSLRSNRDGEKLSLYFNSIEALADVLIPFYDEQMSKEIEQFEKTLIEIQKENNEKLKALCPADYSNRYAGIHHAKKKSAYRNIFRKLNILLKRNDYLKSSVYGEDKDELGVEDDNEGGEE
jgi:hypothetical protein